MADWSRRLELLSVWQNPICVQHRRARLRLLPTLSWGLITLTVVAFIFLLTYFSLTERGEVDPVEAAKTALVFLIIVQGVLLMGLGTSAVATGIARERDQRLLDYHRMSPMSPAAKIVGYLFGLPIREYLLFGLTLPFVAYAVIRAGVPLLKVAHFYCVFFSSVWLYHLTGLMAGMVSRKAWQSSFVSLGLVAGLYLVLPIFARLGLTFFDFLTVRPTFYGMVAEELQRHEFGHRGWVNERMWLVQRYQEVPFFGLRLNPTVFSLAVQGFGLVTLYHVVRRKWVDAAWHPFAKRFSVGFVAAMSMLLAGSVWPLLTDEQTHGTFVKRFGGAGDAAALSLLIGVFVVVCGLAVFLSIGITTPTRHTVRKGLRRSEKLGLSRVPLSWDAATSLPATLMMLLWAGAGYALLLAAVRVSTIYDWTADIQPWLALPPLLAGLVLITVQGMTERFGTRAVILGLFVCWVVPVMVMIVIIAAFEESWAAAMYIGGLCPAVAGALSLASLLDAAAGPIAHDRYLIQQTPAEAHAHAVIVMSVILYTSLAVLAQLLRWRGGRRLRRQVAELSAATHPPAPPRPAAG